MPAAVSAVSSAASSADPVLLEISSRIATVTLNRPNARNALSAEVLRLLPERLAEAEANDGVDVIILTGADPAFCAGLDLKELGSSGSNLAGSSSRSGLPRSLGPTQLLDLARLLGLTQSL